MNTQVTTPNPDLLTRTREAYLSICNDIAAAQLLIELHSELIAACNRQDDRMKELSPIHGLKVLRTIAREQAGHRQATVEMRGRFEDNMHVVEALLTILETQERQQQARPWMVDQSGADKQQHDPNPDNEVDDDPLGPYDEGGEA